jgi:hypothetical protein
MKVGISDRASVETLECGMVPAILTATPNPFSKPNLAEKIHSRPRNPAMAAANATRTPMTTSSNMAPVTQRPMVIGSMLPMAANSSLTDPTPRRCRPAPTRPP